MFLITDITLHCFSLLLMNEWIWKTCNQRSNRFWELEWGRLKFLKLNSVYSGFAFGRKAPPTRHTSTSSNFFQWQRAPGGDCSIYSFITAAKTTSNDLYVSWQTDREEGEGGQAVKSPPAEFPYAALAKNRPLSSPMYNRNLKGTTAGS